MKAVTDWRVPLKCAIKGPYPVEESEAEDDINSYKCAIDIAFPEPVTVGDVTFKNYYTSTVLIQCKRNISETSSADIDSVSWETCSCSLKLMHHDAFEEGSQKRVSFSEKQSLVPLTDVIALRLLLQQSSSRWRKFTVDDIKIYKEPPLGKDRPVAIPTPFSTGHVPKSYVDGEDFEETMNPKLLCAARHLQNIWALAEFAKTCQTSEGIGRFEVDGSYEVVQLQHS